MNHLRVILYYLSLRDAKCLCSARDAIKIRTFKEKDIWRLKIGCDPENVTVFSRFAFDEQKMMQTDANNQVRLYYYTTCERKYDRIKKERINCVWILQFNSIECIFVFCVVFRMCDQVAGMMWTRSYHKHKQFQWWRFIALVLDAIMRFTMMIFFTK